MNIKHTIPQCALILIADGFDEIESVVFLSTLRSVGLYVKSVGLTGGLISGAYGILLKPDSTLAGIQDTIDITTVNLLVFPGNQKYLSILEPDPRIHNLLKQVINQQGFVATNTHGAQVLTPILEQNNLLSDAQQQILVRYPLEESITEFVQQVLNKISQVD